MEQTEHKQGSSTDPVTLGEYIRAAREKRGTSARKLSEALHMHGSYISRVESGKFKQPSPEKLQRIAEYLGLNFDNLCALAGYRAPGLPEFIPYLRAKYDMRDEEARRLSEYFERLRTQHGITKRPEHTTNDTARAA